MSLVNAPENILIPTAKIDLDNIRNKQMHLFIIGHGQVGSLLIDQLIAERENLKKRRRIDLSVVAVANSTTVIFDKQGLEANWRERKEAEGKTYTIPKLIQKAHNHGLYNTVMVDNTASPSFVLNYLPFIEAGFSLVSSNKVANTLGMDFYTSLRERLAKRQQDYLYETNVGAGLPLIDTIKVLHLSGENITRIRGVFSGSLSYIFNRFSEERVPFDKVLQAAIDQGYTEPDPREDLCGNDVARKLLILARELALHCEFEEVAVENLIPVHLRDIDTEQFLSKLKALNAHFVGVKSCCAPDEVLRYVATLEGDLADDYGAQMHVRLEAVPKQSMLGQLSGSDSIFEIYTESYGEHPIVIQGAGAGPKVTARGVFGDILRISERVSA
ncbi:aspartate kinase [Gilvibacter sediminis]|uniref:aspartate kinase n=1 Tax=Gilvibacter sediminis TaxID=379071 RepID=UPI002350B5BB|nr:aspartate kinase [Gilvibacter sediminis]MDC7998690.1 aspartate kinase [Gilvibacter sediminis]